MTCWFFFQSAPGVWGAESPASNRFADTVITLSSFQDRSTGTAGCRKAAAFIKQVFSKIGFDQTGSHHFSVPIRLHQESRFIFPDQHKSFPISPFLANAITPETIPSYRKGSGRDRKWPPKGRIVSADLFSISGPNQA
ncbi:hypothetical protein ACFLZM_07325, partial [Thermodesulfobacteriota bacterium]